MTEVFLEQPLALPRAAKKVIVTVNMKRVTIVTEVKVVSKETAVTVGRAVETVETKCFKKHHQLTGS